MDTQQISVKCGFIKDNNNLQLKEILKDSSKLKEVNIDVYSENPLNPSSSFMLLLRTSEKNAVVSNDGDRIILKRNDKNKTHYMNILFSKIEDCFLKVSENYFEFILNIQNTYYRVTVLN